MSKQEKNSEESKKYIKDLTQSLVLKWSVIERKKHYHKNKESICKYQREYRLNNLERIRKRDREWSKGYREKNRERIRKRQREWYSKNRDKIREIQRQYYQKRKLLK